MPSPPRQKTKPPQPKQPRSGGSALGERLQKVLAAAGVDSRRQCEELIRAGRVEVDRRVITELGFRVDADAQEIRLDGVPLRKTKRLYYAVNKPDGVVSTNRDPAGRPRVVDLLPADHPRMFAVGRLDMHSEGLILLTNDGELANRLAHPRYGVEKVYRVLVAGEPTPEVLAELRRGIHLAEATVRIAKIAVKGRYKKSTSLEMVLDEGRNREIRRAMAKVGHKVQQLIRVAVGPVRLGTLASGKYRLLTPDEVRELRAAVARTPKTADEKPRTPRPSKKTTDWTKPKQGTVLGESKPAARRKPSGSAARKPAGRRPSGGRGPKKH